MSEEEKKAIEYLTKYINWETYGERSLEKDIQTTLNLIEKQQKEIEKLKEENNWLHTEYDTMFDYINELDKNNISKDKIKEKIKELEENEEFYREQDSMCEYNGEITLLNKLLEGE